MKQLIEKRVPHGEGAVTLVVQIEDETCWDWKYLINGVSVGRDQFQLVIAMLALPGRGVP